MSREKDSTALAGFLRELTHFEVYKRSLGRVVRQLTFAAFATIVAVGAYRLSVQAMEAGPLVRYAMPSFVLLAGLWISFRAVCYPPFADFLIAVEAEMAKVYWPDRGTLIRSCVVVLVNIVLLAIVLFAFDLFWKAIMTFLGIG